MSLYVTFSPTADDTVRTSLSKEIRLALRSLKALFYPGGLVLSAASLISAPALFIFHMTLFTLMCLEQLDQVPTPTERPRPASEDATGRAPQGYAPWLPRLLTKVTEDVAKGERPLTWLTPVLIEEGANLTWTSSGNNRTIRGNKNISCCPGAIIAGIPHPYVVGPGSGNSPTCRSILVSIANPAAYHKVLHSGSDSNREFGLHVFPKSVLQQLATTEGVTLPATFLLPSDTAPLINGARVAYPKNLSLRSGAHRASVYGSSAAAKNAAFNAAAKDPVMEAHAMDFMARHVLPQIMSETFAYYETLMADMAEDPTPLTLPCMPEIAPETPH